MLRYIITEPCGRCVKAPWDTTESNRHSYPALFKRYPGVEGSLYFIGGVGINYVAINVGKFPLSNDHAQKMMRRNIFCCNAQKIALCCTAT